MRTKSGLDVIALSCKSKSPLKDICKENSIIECIVELLTDLLINYIKCSIIG